MRDIYPLLLEAARTGSRAVLARVVSTWGSAPRRVGAAMLFVAPDRVSGSVSGGCIEASVLDECLRIGSGSHVFEFGVAGETAWSAGLSCGGTVRVLVHAFPDGGTELADLWLNAIGRESAHVVVSDMDANEHVFVQDSDAVVSTWTGDVDAAVYLAHAALKSRRSFETTVAGRRVFVHAVPPRDRLLIIGGADVAVHLTRMAHHLGFYVSLIDPREVFARSDRFPVAPDRIDPHWPQEVLPDLTLDRSTFAVLLTHDPRVDDPSLDILLNSDVAYIGALGGRKTRDKRNIRLAEKGFSAEQIARIHGPVGLAIGAQTPGEIALSIMAEVVAMRNQAFADESL